MREKKIKQSVLEGEKIKESVHERKKQYFFDDNCEISIARM